MAANMANRYDSVSTLKAPCLQIYHSLNDAIYAYWRSGYNQDVIIHFLQEFQGINLTIRQLKYRIKQIGISKRNQDTDADVENALRFELSKSGSCLGYRSMWQRLRQQHGLNVSRNRIRELLVQLSPNGVADRRRRRFKRGLYHSNGPNESWHMDGHDKLAPYGIHISGCIDGYSRKILWLEAACTNSNPNVIARYFIRTVKQCHGCPLRMRADPGTENVDVAALQTFFRRNGQDAYAGLGSFVYGKSMLNQRIEQFWSILLKSWTEWWRHFFANMEIMDLFVVRSNMDKYLIRFCFMHIIQRELADLSVNWNNHRIRRQPQLRVPQGIPNELYHLPQRTGGMDQLTPVDEQDVRWAEDFFTDVSRIGNDVVEEYFHYIMTANSLLARNTTHEALGLYIRLRTIVAQYN